MRYRADRVIAIDAILTHNLRNVTQSDAHLNLGSDHSGGDPKAK